MSPAVALTIRELRRVLRQPSRVVASLAAPALVLALMGSGLARSSVGGDGGYPGFLVPGVALLAAMFTSVFAAISLIEDRETGLLRVALASPAPSWSIAVGKMAGASIPATIQGAIILIAYWPVSGAQFDPVGALLALGAIALASVAIAGLSLAAAWRSRSVSGFHSVMNLVLMPMWLLSGAVFPPEQAAGWLAEVMGFNPLRFPLEACRGALGAGPPAASGWIGASAFAGATTAAAALTIGRGRARF